jgi:hypothetical protein
MATSLLRNPVWRMRGNRRIGRRIDYASGSKKVG